MTAQAARSVVIENPVLNSPFAEPTRHFRFGDNGITDDVIEERRSSSYFIPIPVPKVKVKSAQLSFDTGQVRDQVKPNDFINRVRERVTLWRKADYPGVTPTTRALLEYWREPDRERRLFFCQIEALETVIYITEIIPKFSEAAIEQELRAFNAAANPGLQRMACKMATGSGKTAVMAMVIAWQTLNKLASPQDNRFSDAFLVVTPGITIRDRLRVLLPNDPGNYYRALDLVPPDRLVELGRAKILITNYHTFKLRERGDASRLTKTILTQGQPSGVFTETPDEMVRRVCRELGSKRNIVVLNDEAHHCYRSKPDSEKLTGDDKKEAEKRDAEARVWISGLEAVAAKIGIRRVFDLSATPFFLRGSGYQEGTLFPWVVSDFSLIDAIESGIVKVPRVPVADNRTGGDLPTYRDLWDNIRDYLPKKGRSGQSLSGSPQLPVMLEGALLSLYGNYEKAYRQWEKQGRGTPPVFIVVCNNTSVSKLVFDYIAGWEKILDSGQTIVVPGKLELFSNEWHGRWLARPNTLLIDSEQLESGETMDDAFKKLAQREIEEFKTDFRRRFPGRDVEEITDEDLLREVMNTVGKQGKLGEQIKCVVSVSMLTEGWDANTVTHILGVRAFRTQLLCEQVVGRGLRRISYEPNEDDRFDPEYAEVYGVPFSFIPSASTNPDPKPPVPVTHVRAMPDRTDLAITFPRVVGYRYELPSETLTAKFTSGSMLILSTASIPTRTENAPIVGASSIHTLDDLKAHRLQEVAFELAALTLEKYFCDDEGNVKPWLFPPLLRITRQWLRDCLVCHDDTYAQLLLVRELAHDAADRIYRAVVTGHVGERLLKPTLRAYNTEGSTREVAFDTVKSVYSTRPDKSHLNYVVADSGWEAKLAQALEDMDEVTCYVKNQGLNFTIPYTLAGKERSYLPDFIVRVRDGRDDPLNLVVEVSGQKKKDKDAKVSTASALWVPAVNNHGGFGRWAFLELTDVGDAKTTIRAFLANR